VLPESFSQDPDRLRRFEQEARAASALNHPNILTIHDIGSYESSPYVVSELLEGATLREALGGGPLPAAGDRSLNVIVCYSGDLKEGERVLRPLRTVANPVRDTVQPRAYIETFTMPPYGETIPTAFSATKGCYLEQLSDAALDIALDRFAQASYPGSAMGFDHYMHGMVCRTAPESTAFELRTPGALHVWVVSGWEDPTAAMGPMAWVQDTWNALQPYSGGRIYANYLSVEGEPGVKAAFGANYPRLVAAKRKYDAANFFHRNQNIIPGKS